MNIEPASEQSEPSHSLLASSIPQINILYLLFVLIMPFVAFGATDILKPEWQDGKLSSYIVLLLSPKASWIFIVLLAFSIASYICLWFDFLRFSSLFVVRLGIYTGVFLALHFSVLEALFLIEGSTQALFLIAVWVFPLIAAWVYPWAAAKWGGKRVAIIFLIVVILAGSVAAIRTFQYTTPFLFLLVALTAAAPFWSFLLAFRVAAWLFKNRETKITLPRGLELIAWFSVYAVAWRYSILRMYELYAALPPQPPNCYIATAAAQGHPRIVGSRVVQHADGNLMRVNQQLQTLKCAELALMAVHPRLHRMLRSIYDVIGKALARGIRNPFLADVVYLSLKPWEWLSRWGLRIIVPEIDAVSRNFYMEP